MIICRANSCRLGRALFGAPRGRPCRARPSPAAARGPGAAGIARRQLRGARPEGAGAPRPPCQWLRGDGSAWTFPLPYRMEIPGLPGEGARAPRSERLIYPRAAAQSGGHGPLRRRLPLPGASRAPRPHHAPRPAAAVAAAAGAAAAGGPAGRRLREPQGEAEGAPAAGGAGRGESGGGRGAGLGRPGAPCGAGGRPEERLFYCKDRGKKNPNQNYEKRPVFGTPRCRAGPLGTGHRRVRPVPFEFSLDFFFLISPWLC